jgi:L-fucose mutarotase
MLTTTLLHPDILMALASNGHGARILIADGNFPVCTKTPVECKKVFLNLSAGMLKVTDVVNVLRDAVAIEAALGMMPPDGLLQPVHQAFREILGSDIPMRFVERFNFYDEACSVDTCLAIVTGDTRRFANILLTLGSVR